MQKRGGGYYGGFQNNYPRYSNPPYMNEERYSHSSQSYGSQGNQHSRQMEQHGFSYSAHQNRYQQQSEPPHNNWQRQSYGNETHNNKPFSSASYPQSSQDLFRMRQTPNEHSQTSRYRENFDRTKVNYSHSNYSYDNSSQAPSTASDQYKPRLPHTTMNDRNMSFKWQDRSNNYHGNNRFTPQSEGNSFSRKRSYNQFQQHTQYEKEGDDNEDAEYGEDEHYDGQEQDEGDYENGKEAEETSLHKSVNVARPSQEIIDKYKYYPPSPQEMAQLLPGLVVFFYIKRLKPKRENMFVSILETVATQFGRMSVEDGHMEGQPHNKFCTVRWNDILFSRGLSVNNNIKEARIRAGFALINNLAMLSYTLYMKEDYHSPSGMQKLLQQDEVEGLYKVMKQNVDLPSAIKLIKVNLSDDTDVELIFPRKDLVTQLKIFARDNGYDYRIVNGVIAISNLRSPQYWRDKMLSSQITENVRFKLVPPQGIGNNLLQESAIMNEVPVLRNRLGSLACDSSKEDIPLFGPEGTGPKIIENKVPWAQRGNQGGNRNKFRGKRGGGGRKRRR